MAFQTIPAGTAGGPSARSASAVVASACLRLIVALVALLSVGVGASQAQTMRGTVGVSTDHGFARLVFRFRREASASVRVANNIVIVSFASPISINVDRLSTGAPDYISAARLDPDGKAVRIALMRPVKANLTPTGEEVFLDLLPDSWSGPPPGLPPEVIEDLTRRTREAEQRARVREQLATWNKVAPVRVRVAKQPTFTRYTFPLSTPVGVGSDRTPDGLTLVFDAPLKIDLADALLELPPFITSIEPTLNDNTSSVHFVFNGKVDVRTFREDNSYVLDASATPVAPAPSEAEGKPKGEQATGPGGDLVSKVLEELDQTVPPPGNSETVDNTAPATVPAAAASSSGGTAGKAAAAADDKRAPAPAAKAGADAKSVAAPATNTPVKVTIKRLDNAVRLVFPFATETPAAMFRRADTMWLVFDSDAAIDVDALRAGRKGVIRSVSVSHADGQIVRLKLDRPRLGSMVMEGSGWAITIGDAVTDPIAPITLNRTIVGPGRASIVAPFEDAGQVHRIADPEAGDTLLVVTAPAPVRGVLKPQEFVELNVLASTQGVVVEPLADDIKIEIDADRLIIGRPNGLILSASTDDEQRDRIKTATLFDVKQWKTQRNGDFFSRQSELFDVAAMAPPEQQSEVHRKLARFYLARQMYPEATAALDIALSAHHTKDEEAGMHVLRAVAELMSGRIDEAAKDLSHPSIGNQYEAPLWRAMAHALKGEWAQARKGFQNAEMTIGLMPIELQRTVLMISVRAALEVGDLNSASTQLNGFETIGATPEQQADIDVLRGRIAEKLRRTGDAIAQYQKAIDSNNRRAAVQARLRQAILKMSIDELKRPDAIAEFETISMIWRGGDTEIEALQMLAKLYTEDGRLRDAFGVMRTALTANATSEVTRRIQEDAAAKFQQLFLSGKGDALSPIDALSLFYDFRDLTPMGRRGDEMIRRLADRLVSIDLLDQAAELLQHQVDKRLQGAARAQVASRLATIYLMNNKPEQALSVLQKTHMSGFSDTLRNRRLLLEARALSQLGRPDVALEVIANISGDDADRLRIDILWKAQRWHKAAEQVEAVLGDRWKDWQPLSERERRDVLRAGIGYALGGDKIGAQRLRERYAAKMADGPDRRAFEVVTGPIDARRAEFSAITANVNSTNMLDGFLNDLRAGFPEAVTSDKASSGQDTPPPRAPSRTTGESPAPDGAPTNAAARPAAAPKAQPPP
jgi:tetratricopeptide (TPR) repeat protein